MADSVSEGLRGAGAKGLAATRPAIVPEPRALPERGPPDIPYDAARGPGERLPGGAVRRLTIGWLLLAVGGLLVSSLYGALLVLARLPGLASASHLRGLFPTALVLHVDLAIVVWLLAYAGVWWALTSGPRLAWLGAIALVTAAGGALLLALGPLLEPAPARLSNYIPVLAHGGFLLGLGLFASGVALMAARRLAACALERAATATPLGLGSCGAALAVLSAAVVLCGAFWRLPEGLAGVARYDALFWGPGHLLQTGHMLLLLSTWWLLTRPAGPPARYLIAAAAFLILAPVLAAYPLVLTEVPGGVAYREGFTRLMVASGAAGGLAAIALTPWLWGGGRLRPGAVASGVRLSHLLFLAGVVIGTQIRADDAWVPAHYHGTVGAVTLGFMSLSYWLLPRLGWDEVPRRAAALQAATYATGLALLIGGLIATGLPRKALPSGDPDGLVTALGMMVAGLGGLLALAGALLFVGLAARALWPRAGSAYVYGAAE